MAKRTQIQSIDRALEILELIAASDAPMRNVDVASRLELDPHTAHTIVRSLYQHGYLAQDENSRYLLGPACLRLQNRVHGRFHQLALAGREPIRRLAEENGDTSFLGAEFQGCLYCVLNLHHNQWNLSENQAWLDCLHATAAGKLIIAEKGLEWFSALTAVGELKAFTPETITTPEAMKPQIEITRRNGYSLSVREHRANLSALAVAVRDREGNFVAVLAQSFPDIYLETGRINVEERVALLRKYAADIERNLNTLQNV